MLAVHLIINLLMKVLGQVGGGGGGFDKQLPTERLLTHQSSSEDVTAGSETSFMENQHVQV